MSNSRKVRRGEGRFFRDLAPTNPRAAGGDISGPGGPHDAHAVVVDTGRAVLLDYTEVCAVQTGRVGPDGSRQMNAEPAVAMLMAGRINKSSDRASIVFLFDTDGAAAIISELVALAGRMGPMAREDLRRRLRALHEEGHDRPAPEG